VNLIPRRPAAARTFRVAAQGDAWQVTRDEAVYGDFLTRGEAVRAACFAARTAENRGGTVRVLAPPNDRLIPHYEPFFDS